MKHVEGLDISFLGAEKGVGMNWRQGKIKAFTCKRTACELGLKVWQVPQGCLRHKKGRESKEKEIENAGFQRSFQDRAAKEVRPGSHN